MSARISYKKQAALTIMSLFVLFTLLAGIAEFYYLFIPNCQYAKSEALMDLNIFERNQLCSDYRMVKYSYESGYKQHVPDQHYATVNINEQGFRGPEFPVQKPDGTYRIFFLGGSTAFGYGSTSDETTISGYLQTMYDMHGLPFEVEVINAGIGNVMSYTESIMIQDRLLDMGPNLFIIYDGWNDAGKHPDNPGTSDEVHRKIMKGEITLDELEPKPSFKDIYRGWKITGLIVDIRDNLLQNKQSSVRIYDDTPIDEKVSIWIDRWNEVCAMGGERGFDVMVLVQPILGSGNYTMREAEVYQYESNNNKVLVERLAYYAEALFKLDSCASTADMRDALDDVSIPIFVDAGHLNDFGNEVVASAIFEESYPIVKKWGASQQVGILEKIRGIIPENYKTAQKVSAETISNFVPAVYI